jgi:hypothetical protein
MEKEKNEMVAKAIEELKPNTEFAEWYDKLSDHIDIDVANHVFIAYKKGCDEYNTRAWNAEYKYQQLCIKVCEKFI